MKIDWSFSLIQNLSLVIFSITNYNGERYRNLAVNIFRIFTIWLKEWHQSVLQWLGTWMLSLENILENYYSKIPWEVKIISHYLKIISLLFPSIYFFRKPKDSTNHLLKTLWLYIIILVSFIVFLPKKIKHLKIKEWLLLSMQQNKFIY